MYRNGNIYDEMCMVAIDIYIDYDIRKFPVDEKELCRKMGIALIPYSEFEDDEILLLIKRTEHGFFVRESIETPPTIYYNDISKTDGEKRFTIFHEIKHYVCEDENDEDDDLADYFARYMMCPIPYLLLKNIVTKNEIASFCGTSLSAAGNASRNIINRRNRYGYEIFDYEFDLIEHLEPVLIEVSKKSNR